MIKKLYVILNEKQRTAALGLGFLLFIGIFLEMLGLGMLLPVISLLASPDYVFPVKSIPIIRDIAFSADFNFTVFLMVSLGSLFLIKTIFLTLLAWRHSKFSAELEAEISSRMLLGYLRESYLFHTQKNRAELLRNLKIEVGQFLEFVCRAIELIIEIGIVMGLIVALLLIDPSSTVLITALFAAPCWLMYFMLKDRLQNWGEIRQTSEEKIQRYALEGLSLVKEIKLSSTEPYFQKSFSESCYVRADVIKKQRTLLQLPRLWLEMIAVLALISFILIMYSNGKSLTSIIPILGTFGFAAFRLLPSVNRIMTSVNFMRYSHSVVDLVYSELKSLSALSEEPALKTLAKLRFSNSIEFKNINFMYPGSDDKQLKEVSFSIKKGGSVGFIGATGSGKTTAMNILLGLIEPNCGEVLVDGRNIHNHRKEWQQKIGYVPQQITLIDGSIVNNIAFGIPDELIEEEQIKAVMEAAQLTEFIASLPEGLSTIIGENGVRLSGGQRQRIGLARALYNNPEVLVFDEATSALDSDTEMEVMASISRMAREKTIIMVAHRLSTLDNCDHIFKFSNGQLVNKNKNKKKPQAKEL